MIGLQNTIVPVMTDEGLIFALYKHHLKGDKNKTNNSFKD